MPEYREQVNSGYILGDSNGKNLPLFYTFIFHQFSVTAIKHIHKLITVYLSNKL